MRHSFKYIILCPLAAGTAALPALSGGAQTRTPETQVHYLQPSTVTIETKDGQDYNFNVEMATTGEDQARGLMHRTHMSSDSGMLFLFGDEERRSFWMKDTLIPLDIIFIGRDGIIDHIHHSAKPQDETRITSEKPAFAVLEINGGQAGSLNIVEGDKIIHPAFRNMDVAPH